ncbi:protein phosphatase CheZ [Aliikangiella coralliicola]|uniref:Protein phosphatase CheZ n=1 Tax=Aliikangiella coralliicola TaxID=2592383 RepID=A0A545UB52_9GAMM|nr:protein phosphatase CheZ [Aliikangiella coralliicola]TQV86694.1 protein phosphatase CheZ [Aliikangiella coralliicola]
MKLSDKEQLEKTIAQTRDLLEHLENDEIEDAQELIDTLARDGDEDLFIEIGKLTRRLHEALNSFQLDSRITDIAASEIPNAKDRLNYVIERTEEAANKTMDKVEQCNQLADVIAKDSEDLLSEWQKLYRRELEPGDFRKLCKRIESHLEKNKDSATDLHAKLSDVLLAQDYQDLTGQVIRQVITLVQDVEDSMVHVIKMFGNMDGYAAAQNEQKVTKGAEGPVVNKEKRDDVVSGQDEVDDLLSSLGF